MAYMTEQQVGDTVTFLNVLTEKVVRERRQRIDARGASREDGCSGGIGRFGPAIRMDPDRVDKRELATHHRDDRVLDIPTQTGGEGPFRNDGLTRRHGGSQQRRDGGVTGVGHKIPVPCVDIEPELGVFGSLYRVGHPGPLSVVA
jgi:hypothetical protein